MRIELPSGSGACELKLLEEFSSVSKQPHVVEFKNVTKTYGMGTAREFTAIKDVSFTVEDIPRIGEFVGILGPSGCGKSTVLRLIAGLSPQFPQTTGDVLVKGVPVTEPGPDRGMVFQDYTSFDNRTVLDNVAFGLECQGMGKKERYDLSRDWIARVGLDPVHDLNKYPHELSGGMKQRVAIARTLILKPRIILMDEPFGALDPVTRHRMQDLLVELWRDLEATVFFVTHDVSESVYLGDRVYILSNSPGTILKQLQVMPPDRPSKIMAREKAFQDSVFEITNMLDELEEGNE
jgi:NitT/TauT family transport system ATP-binding protein